MDKPKKLTAGNDIKKSEAARKKKKNRRREQAKDRQKAKDDTSDIVKSDLADVDDAANCKTSKSETFEIMKSSMNNIRTKSYNRCFDKVFNSCSCDPCTGKLGDKDMDNSTDTLKVPRKIADEKTTECARLNGEHGGDEVSLEQQMLGLRIVGSMGRHSRGRIKHSCACCGLEEPMPKTFKKCKRYVIWAVVRLTR